MGYLDNIAPNGRISKAETALLFVVGFTHDVVLVLERLQSHKGHVCFLEIVDLRVDALPKLSEHFLFALVNIFLQSF